MFCDSFPVNFTMPHSLSHSAAATYLSPGNGSEKEEREEQGRTLCPTSLTCISLPCTFLNPRSSSCPTLYECYRYSLTMTGCLAAIQSSDGLEKGTYDMDTKF
uniref:Uncharacterized protein n=1 Tax=Micrurus lemniscatus lemniscatus TaxID=129467 RepID=A0A2D4HQ20_MICLE